MKYTKLLSFAFCAFLTVGVSSCGSNNKGNETLKNKWDYTKEELGEALNLDIYTKIEDEQKIFYCPHYEQYLTDVLTSNDIVVFDFEKAYEIMTSDDFENEILDYQTLRSCEIEYYNVTTDDDKYSFSISAPLDTTDMLGIIVNKEKVVDEKYVFAYETDMFVLDSDPNDVAEAQEKFEKDYGKTKRAIIGTTVTEAILGIGTMVIGAIGIGEGPDPATLFAGFAMFMNSIVGGALNSREPSLRDVLEKLYILDAKVDALDKKISENFKLMQADALQTQEYVNQILLNQYSGNIDTFEADFIKPVNTLNRDMNLIVQNKLKNTIAGSATIDVPFYLNDEKVICYRSLTEVPLHPEDEVVTVKVNEFKNAKKALADNRNIFVNDVLEAFVLDLYEATEGVTLPKDVSRELLSNYALLRLVQEIRKAYYASHKAEAGTYAGTIVDLCGRFNGFIGTTILDSYQNRLKYMYNFGSEMKKAFNTITAKETNRIDMAYLAGMEACYYAEINYEELVASYTGAINAINTYSDNVNSIPDGYSFILEKKVGATLYSSYTDSCFTKVGKYPTHYNKFNLYRYGGKTLSEKTAIDWEKDYNSVSAHDHAKLINRLKVLKNSGAVASDVGYADYLTNVGVCNTEVPNMIKDGISKKIIKNDPYKIVTEIKHRDVTSSAEDCNIDCYFTQKGVGDAYYFNINQYYKYRSIHNKDCWHATMWETTYLDAKTGDELTNEKVVGLEGCFDEDYWYWRNPERFRFNDGPNERFFYSLTYQA